MFKAAEREKGRTAARRNTGRAWAMSALYPARARSELTVRRANMAVKGENSRPRSNHLRQKIGSPAGSRAGLHRIRAAAEWQREEQGRPSSTRGGAHQQSRRQATPLPPTSPLRRPLPLEKFLHNQTRINSPRSSLPPPMLSLFRPTLTRSFSLSLRAA